MLFSSVFDEEGNLYYDKEYGICEKMTMEELHDFLRPVDGADLNIDVAIINIVNGEQIANVFKKLGAVEVFTYGCLSDKKGVQVVDHEVREIMRHFSANIIEKFIAEETFLNAFESAKKEIKSSLLNSDDIEFKWIQDGEGGNKNN